MTRRRKLLWRVLAWMGVSSLLLPLAGYVLLRALVSPLPGEWQTTVSIGPVRFAAGVPSMIRLATSHWVAPRLNGRQIATDVGVLRAAWLPQANALLVRCAPCTLRQAAPGAPAVQVAALEITVQRDFDQLQGLFQIDVQDGGVNGGASGSWQGALEPTRIRLAVDVAHAQGGRQALFWALPTAFH